MNFNLFFDLLSIIAPCRCLVCERNLCREIICRSCLDLSRYKVDRLNSCKVCSIAYFDDQGICPRCAANPLRVDSVRALYWYRDGVAWLIRAAKYRPSLALTRLLAEMLAQECDQLRCDLPAAQLVTYIPASRESLLIRGFNQSQLIAAAVAKHLRLPLVGAALHLRGHATRSALLAREKRRLNFSGAFTAVPRHVADKTVLLIDDVVTSGATAASATRALRRAGASSVQLLCFARAPGEIENLRSTPLRDVQASKTFDDDCPKRVKAS